MRLIITLILAAPLLAQTNAIQICDQQTPTSARKCVTIKAPAALTNNALVLFDANASFHLPNEFFIDNDLLRMATVGGNTILVPSANGVGNHWVLYPTTGTLPTDTLSEFTIYRHTLADETAGNIARMSWSAWTSPCECWAIQGEAFGTGLFRTFIVQPGPTENLRFNPDGTNYVGLGFSGSFDAMIFQPATVGTPGTSNDSPHAMFVSEAFDTSFHYSQWRLYAFATNNSGNADFLLQSNVDATSPVDRLRIHDDGTIKVYGSIIPTSGTNSIGTSGAHFSSGGLSDSSYIDWLLSEGITFFNDVLFNWRLGVTASTDTPPNEFTIKQVSATVPALLLKNGLTGLKGDLNVNNLYLDSLISAGTQCVQVNTSGQLTGTGTACSGGGGSPFIDSTAIIYNAADATKLIKINASAITTGTTRTYTGPDANGTFDLIDVAQTISASKTFTADILGDGTHGVGTGAAHFASGYIDNLTAVAVDLNNNILATWLVGVTDSTATPANAFSVKKASNTVAALLMTQNISGVKGSMEINDLTLDGLVSGGNQCVQANTSGQLVGTGTSCGGSGGAIPTINGLSGALNIVGTGHQIGVASAGTTITISAGQNIDASSNPTFVNVVLTSLTGSTQCMELSSGGVPHGTGSPCGSGGSGLPTTGGTMTGSILANGSANIGGTASTTWFANGYFGNTVEANILQVNTGNPSSPGTSCAMKMLFGNMVFTCGTTMFSLNSSSLEAVFSGTARPLGNNTQNLGLTGNQWQNIYFGTSLIQNGNTLINNTGAAFFTGMTSTGGLLVSGSDSSFFDRVQFFNTINTSSGVPLNGSQNCPGGQHVSGITYYYGLALSQSCS